MSKAPYISKINIVENRGQSDDEVYGSVAKIWHINIPFVMFLTGFVK